MLLLLVPCFALHVQDAIIVSSVSIKRIIVFTHNLNTINIANSQHNGLFVYGVFGKKEKCFIYKNTRLIDLLSRF